MKSVGILGLGTYLPPIVRKNDWWPANVVAKWGDRMATRATSADAPVPVAMTDGARRTLVAMAEYAGDPFRGAIERRVMPDDMTAPEMEARAAREAMDRAGVRPDEIDVILTQPRIPENLLVNSAGATHALLGLPRRCMALQTNAACNGFAMHVSLAQGLIASGQARYVLTVHSSAIARILRRDEPDSAWMGDGAAAAVLGPVSEGNGVIGAVHQADGTNCNALVLGVPDKRWWDDGRIVMYAPDRDHTRAMLLSLVDRAGDGIGAALAHAGVRAADVNFYASHQCMAWFTPVTAAHAGLVNAKQLVTFPAFGNLSNVNVPLILAIGERERMFGDGSIVVAFSGGIGETWSGLVLRWGR